MGTVNDSRAVDSAFIDLLCQDDDLVRAEFDALVAASWHLPPPLPPAAPRPADQPPSRSWPAAREAPPTAGRRPIGAGLRHQRSPPAEAG
jgi:hypothetical protein